MSLLSEVDGTATGGIKGSGLQTGNIISASIASWAEM
jgi:hypothetical protein